MADDYAFKRNDLPFLDGLRGLAALIVVFSHLGLRGWAEIGGVGLAGAGKSGVYLFFLLSAYLLTRIMLDKDDKAWRIASIARFFARRVLRIYPLFILFLLTCFGLSIASGSSGGTPYAMDVNAVAAHLALLRGDGVLWSIPVEFKYYLVLPFVAFAFSVLSRQSHSRMLIAATAACLGVEIVSDWIADDPVSLIRHLQIFIIGSAFAAIDLRIERSRAASREDVRRGATLLALICAVGLAFLVPSVFSVLTGWEDPTPMIHRLYAAHGLLWLGVIAGLKYGTPMLRKPFERPVARAVGVISFSLYIWHDLIFAHLARIGYDVAGAFAWAPPLALALAAAAISFRVVERPFLMIGNRPGPRT